MRSLVAPWYLIASVGLSYLAALGLSVLVFIDIRGASGLDFILPIAAAFEQMSAERKKR